MPRQNKSMALMLLAGIIAVLLGWHYLSGEQIPQSSQDWTVSDEGWLKYSVAAPTFNISAPKIDGNSTLFQVSFSSRDAEIAAILRIPGIISQENATAEEKRVLPGIVLLPGATVTKEAEQGLARRLAGLGYASITLDQRNLGIINPQEDLQLFLRDEEPVEHKMVHDALAAAEILRCQPQIDPSRIIYAGESNGGRFAIIACALDKEARGVLAISTCGYGTDATLASAARGVEGDMARFYLSIDPESYLNEIAPRPLVMIHSRNDTVIPYRLAEQTFTLGSQPKRLHSVGCQTHGYCPEMDGALREELGRMA